MATIGKSAKTTSNHEEVTLLGRPLSTLLSKLRGSKRKRLSIPLSESKNFSSQPSSVPLSGLKIYKHLRDVPYARDDRARTFYGSNTSVFKADLVTGSLRETFAIKEIKIEGARLDADRKRNDLQREIDMLRKCNQWNIIELRGVYQIEDDPWKDSIFLVTSPWAPVSLQHFLDNSTATGKSVLCPWYSSTAMICVVYGYVVGLAYLHENEIKHKDIKPDNLLLLSEGDEIPRPIIADLGISKVYKRESPTTFRGTYQYLAPEQIRQIESTPKSDVFAMGACFAYIAGVMYNGNAGYREIYNAFTTIGRSCQFGNELRYIRPILERLRDSDVSVDQHISPSQGATSPRSDVREHLGRRIIVEIALEMPNEDPRDRLTSKKVFLSFWEKCGPFCK
ncbi:hypothetical protein MMC17_003128 [Xylographa soralifera]|nr:hypothetical protein [Xylographa soralifera]